MVRVTIGAARRRKKNRYFKQAKGFWGGRSKLWRTVRETLLRAWAYASATAGTRSASSAACGSCASTPPRACAG